MNHVLLDMTRRDLNLVQGGKWIKRKWCLVSVPSSFFISTAKTRVSRGKENSVRYSHKFRKVWYTSFECPEQCWLKYKMKIGMSLLWEELCLFFWKSLKKLENILIYDKTTNFYFRRRERSWCNWSWTAARLMCWRWLPRPMLPSSELSSPCWRVSTVNR